MAKKPVQYSVIDAFTDSPFKGNPAAICLLEEERDEEWMQSVAMEFNISETAFLRRVDPDVDNGSENGHPNSRFHLRWFTPVEEVKLCGHATLASAHFLFTSGLSTTNRIEFFTKSGLLTAKKVDRFKQLDTLRSSNDKREERFSIELDFPTIPFVDCDSTEIPSIPRTLNGASMLNVKRTADGDVIVELPSGKAVADLRPQFDELRECAASGVIITGLAPDGSGFDFFTRFFCPKLGLNEEQNEMIETRQIYEGGKQTLKRDKFGDRMVGTRKLTFFESNGDIRRIKEYRWSDWINKLGRRHGGWHIMVDGTISLFL